MKSLVAIPNTVHLSHPRICAFYEKNPSISPETVNLLIIDLFEATTTEANSDLCDIISTHHNLYQITELTNTLEKIKTTISTKSVSLTSDFLIAKNKYVNEFRSIWMQSNCVSKRNLLLENNDTIINTLEHLTREIRNIKGIHHNISDKIGTIINQFHKIIHTNIESILSKTVDMNTLSKEFIQNFEMNSTHMIQTIQQQLCDFVSAKEKHTKTTIDALTSKGEGSNTMYTKLLYELNDFLHYMAIQPTSPDITPNFETILSRLYNTAFIQADTTSPASNFVLSRVDKPELFIQQCNITDRNINMDEIAEFLQTAENQNRHGILISQHTGITSKPNLFIEIIHSRVFLYVHNMEYSPEKLKIAIEIVDTISAKLSEFNVSTDEKYSIPKEVLDEMNREYQSFICQKELILNTLKDTHKKLLGQIEDIRFVSLDKYLSTRYSSCKKQGYVCSLCNSFTVSTLKGLAAHKRGCNRKLSGVSSTTQKTSSEPIKIQLIKKDATAVPENSFEMDNCNLCI